MGEEALMSENGYFRPPSGRYAYLRRGAPVLAIAHLDYIGRGQHFEVARLPGEDLVFCESLDDRLGAYIIRELLPALGIKTDVLLTTGEESANSSASDWCDDFAVSARDDYNWIVSFDRRGEGAVLYQYDESPEWKFAIADYFDLQIGTYSDISSMGRLHRCGVNIGTGYHAEHTTRCHFSTAELNAQLSRFKAFYDDYSEIAFEHKPRYDFRSRSPRAYFQGHWYDSDYDIHLDASGHSKECGRSKTSTTTYTRDDWRAYMGECQDAEWVDLDDNDPAPVVARKDIEACPASIEGAFYCLTCGEGIEIVEYEAVGPSWVPVCPLCSSDHVIHESDFNR